MTMKLYRAVLYRKTNGCAPVFVQIVAASKKAAIQEAKAVAENEKCLFRSIELLDV